MFITVGNTQKYKDLYDLLTSMSCQLTIDMPAIFEKSNQSMLLFCSLKSYANVKYIMLTQKDRI